MRQALRRGAFPRLAAVLTLLLLAWPARSPAQTTTGTLRGNVTDGSGGALPGVTVEAVNDDSGYRATAYTEQTGFYNLSLPPGSYTVTASLQGLGTATRKARVLLGQTQLLDFAVRATAEAAVTVTAEAPLIETKTNEIATNVTEEQIKALPQGNRNFLNFAALSPGVRISDDEQRKEVNAAGAEGFNTNVFIDGASYKNDVLLGGVAGQDASRGNPFPQNAVQEFRVLTQNFKAEYEKATTSIITAVTKSGTNEYHGDAFGYYQDKHLVARDFFQKKNDVDKPKYERVQLGASVGGPIVRDSVHFFGAWEYNDQTRENLVTVGPQIIVASPALRSELEGRAGFFESPFTSNLFFAKLSWQAATSGLLDVSGFYRNEDETRDFGDRDSFQAATALTNSVWNAQAKYTMAGRSFLSETTIGYNDYQWMTEPSNPNLVGRNYQNALRVGGNSDTQDFHQKRFSIREDFSLLNIHAAGDHVVKVGAVVNFNKYDVRKTQRGNPLFEFRSDLGFDMPFQALYGVGNPDLSTDNTQYGIYLQDDWTASSRLTLNLGIRWDYETDMLNNDFVTPASVRADLEGFIPDRYFTDGNDRDAYTNAFQPRVGISFDITGKGKTVAFGGYGRYVDRDVYNFVLDERFRLQWQVRTFRFSADGQPRDGQPTILWDPSYLSVAGLNSLIAQGVAPKPEVFLLDNNTEPPQTDQYSVGLRQALGPVGLSVSYAGIRGKNGFTWVFGTRRPDGTCCLSLANYSNVLLSDAHKKFWYDALLVSVDKPFTASSRWGATIAYTYAEPEQTGNDTFTFDCQPAECAAGVAHYRRHPTANAERNRLVISGIVGLPWDLRFSTLITIGSGLRYTISDASQGFGPNEFVQRLYEGGQEGSFPFDAPYQSWDFRLQKDFLIAKLVTVGVIGEVFNATNHSNFKQNFEGFIRPINDPAGPNPDFGKPREVSTPGRRFQFGLTVGF